MKKLIIILLMCLPVVVRAEWSDSTTRLVANTIYEQLNRDTSGTDALPRYLVLEYAKEGFNEAGIRIGVEAGKICTSAAYGKAIFVDTGLIGVVDVVFDSLGYPRRNLRDVPRDSLYRYQFSGVIIPQKNATHYAQWGDSILIAPQSSDQDVFEVRYIRKVKQPTDSLTTTELEQEYRNAAIAWGCYRASERLINGRAEEFLNRFEYFIKRSGR